MFILKFIILVIVLLSWHVEIVSSSTNICFKRQVNAEGKRVKGPVCCKGYIRDEAASEEKRTLVCKPICMPACVNATCTNPGECECNLGYRANTTDAHICEPVCKPIPFSRCIAPDTIACNHGYILVNNTCQPVCTEPCVFGTCIAPEFCQCHPGFRLTDANVCEPYCSRGCYQGTCQAPELCKCYDGWSSFEGTCICNKTCENDTCIAPDTCECDFILVNDKCVNESGLITTTPYYDETTTEAEVATEYDEAQTNLSAIFVDATYKVIEYRNDSIMDAVASQSQSSCNWSWLWIVILILLLILLIALCAYKWRTVFDYWKGKSYDVGEYEARECRRRSVGQQNIEINYLKNK